MLRASWALVSLSFIPGARSRLDLPLPVFFTSSLRLWRQDRHFASSPKIFAAKDSQSMPATLEVASDDNRKSETERDLFTPSADTPPTFRFPPFPLASVEELEPRASAEPEPDNDTDIFEPPTLEYRASERLTQLSVDILTQVHRSLPEMLPEPETDPGSIFENKWNDDYAGISTSSTPPITSTQSLEMLVADRDYDEALRVLDALLEVGTEIPFSYAYESAALSAVKAPASDATEMDRQIKTFKKWFSLIPPVDQSRPRTFKRLRAHILLSPLNSLRLIMEFGLIAAEKGYIMQHFNATTVVCMYGDPSVTSQFIDELRRRYRIFLERSSKGGDVDYLDNRFRVDVVGVAVRTLARAGRFDHAVQLIPDPLETNFHLSPYTYNFLVHKMEMTKDTRYLPHIRFITQHKQETTFRSVGLKKMPKPKLALAVRCLGNIDQFSLAIRLLPHLQHGETELMINSLDFLLAKLRESGDGQYSTYIDQLSQLRATTQRISPAVSDSAATSAETQSDPTAPEFGTLEYHSAIKVLTRAWCLEEALALIPVFHRTNTRHLISIYNPLLTKLKASCNPKYVRYLKPIIELRDLTVKLATRKRVEAGSARERDQSSIEWPTVQLAVEKGAEAGSTKEEGKDGTSSEAVRHAESFSAEEISMASSLSDSSSPQRPGSDLAASLRALKKGFRAPTERPHPLTVVHFIEAYLASGRTRAIPLLRNFVLRRVTPGITTGSISYIFAEMLFHARCRNPDLVIQTFVTHFFIVGLPRDDLLQRMRAMERNPLTSALWECTPKMKIFPHPVHTAAVWRALLELTTDERALEALYAKLIRFANLRSEQSSAMHPGVPFLTPPPSWKTGVDASAFTPFIRRICSAFGTERGGPTLQDMIRLGIRPTIHQLTELAMAYSSAGEVRKTVVMLDQLEKSMEARKALIEGETAANVDSHKAAEEGGPDDATEQVDTLDANEGAGQIVAAEQIDADKAGDAEVAARRRAIRARLLPPVDSVFYVAVIRGFLLSNRVTAAKDVKKRMDKHFSYESGTSPHIDELEEDLRAAERAAAAASPHNHAVGQVQRAA